MNTYHRCQNYWFDRKYLQIKKKVKIKERAYDQKITKKGKEELPLPFSLGVK
jgi:hypothetical protein